MKTLPTLVVLLAGLGLLGTPSAHADVYVPRPRIRAMPSVRLAEVRMTRSDAPAADATRVEREVRAELLSRRTRLQRCLAGADLREDPMRSRSRGLGGRLVFDRSGRPSVHVDRSRGVPRAARGCIVEILRSVAARTAPRGRVEVRFRYTVG